MYCNVLNRNFGRSLGNLYGRGRGTIWMDDVRCRGTETKLYNCPHYGWGRHNCGHHEDVSIYCPSGKNNQHFSFAENDRFVLAVVVATILAITAATQFTRTRLPTCYPTCWTTSSSTLMDYSHDIQNRPTSSPTSRVCWPTKMKAHILANLAPEIAHVADISKRMSKW